jgi:hypothetical protein
MTIVSVKVTKPKRQRKPTLASALRGAAKAGHRVRGAVVNMDGSIRLEFSDPDAASANNPWDAVLGP